MTVADLGLVAVILDEGVLQPVQVTTGEEGGRLIVATSRQA